MGLSIYISCMCMGVCMCVCVRVHACTLNLATLHGESEHTDPYHHGENIL